LLFSAKKYPEINHRKKSWKHANYFFIWGLRATSLWKIRRMKRPKHKLYDAAYTLFVEQGMTCAAIAETLNMKRVETLSEWRQGMRWEDDRKRFLTSPAQIRRLLLSEMERVANGEPSKINTDALSKIGKALTYFDGKLSVTVIIAVLKEFDLFMAEVNPHKAVEFLEYHKQFVHHRAKLENMK